MEAEAVDFLLAELPFPASAPASLLQLKFGFRIQLF